MDEENSTSSCLVASVPRKSDGLHPLFFGISCAFSALNLFPEDEIKEAKRSEIRSKILCGTVHLLGMLLWRVHQEEEEEEKASSGTSNLLSKLKNAEREIKDLKCRRTEDAKANEKVVSMFAAQEQVWFVERKKLRQQIGAHLNELRVLSASKNEEISELNRQLDDMDSLLQSKDKLLEGETEKRRECEEKLKRAENKVEEVQESLTREAREHSTELWKHKTAFIELVSTQRQLEAEMGRAVRQVEAAKREVDSVLEQKDQYILMTQKLSMELLKTRKDLEQKDKILSVMLRKSRLDTAEKEMLLKEVRLSKSKRPDRYSLGNMLSKHHKSKSDALSSGNRIGYGTNLLEYKQSEHGSSLSECYMTGESENLSANRLESWVRAEAEKYATAVDQKHNLEVEAFAEQLRLKDEKLEAFRWRYLSMEVESKRLESHIEGLDHNLSQLKQDNLKLESLLSDCEAEIISLKGQLELQNLLKGRPNSPTHHPAITQDIVWSDLKMTKRKPREKEQETTDKPEENPSVSSSKDIVLAVQSLEKEFKFKEEQTVGSDSSSVKNKRSCKTSESLPYNIEYSSWKMDLHALGVSYKIKRLNQQLLMFERLTGKQESRENGECDDKKWIGAKGFYGLVSLLNKQVSRYQSLQGKVDELCRRMQESKVNAKCGGSGEAKPKEETRTLEQFLEETFQLQRYIVATGQKLMEIQTKVASGCADTTEESGGPADFDLKRFSDGIGTLFREVQRGLEVRASRIIGDLEGTLARDGIIHLRDAVVQY